jgi:hypothetical protein
MPGLEIPTGRGEGWGGRAVEIRYGLMDAAFQQIPRVTH